MTDLTLTSLTVDFDRFRAVDDLSMTVASGEWLALIGPNGAGKSTLLRAVVRLVAHEGRIDIGDVDHATLSRRELSRLVALVPQDPQCPPEMHVADYIMLGRSPYIGYFGTEQRHDLHVVADVAEQLELDEHLGRTLGTLSGGELQRVVLARSLAQQAPLLLLDEPTSALDVGHQQQVLELVEQLRRDHGLTVISAMHDLTLAGQFADRLLLMSNGRAVVSGPPSAVLTEHMISEHYGASVRVIDDDEGGLIVVPTRTKARRRGVQA